MEPKILEEVRKHYQQETFDFDWEPIRKAPRKYTVVYPVVGYVVSLLAMRFIALGAFVWLFFVAGLLFFFGGIFCTHGVVTEYKKIRQIPKAQGILSKDEETCVDCET